MKIQYYLLLIVISSLFVFLEWGTDQKSLLWEAEWTIFEKALTNPKDFLHPFIGIPLFGQLILLVNIFRKEISRTWVYLGIGAMAILIVFVAVVGLLSLNVKIILSTLPFLVFSTLVVVQLKKKSAIV